MVASRDVEGRLMLTLKVKETPGGTLLTQDEQYTIPEEVIDRKDAVSEGKVKSVPNSMYQALKEIARTLFGDPEEIRRKRKIQLSLRENLKVWLMLIKDTLEKQHSSHAQ